jgi:hypothetical protein
MAFLCFHFCFQSLQMNCSSKHFGSSLVVPAAEEGAQGKSGADGSDGVNLK